MEHEEIENDQHLTGFGKLLRSERTLKGDKSAKKMVIALGISDGMLSEIENGKKRGYPDIDFLIRCMDYFGWRILENDDKDNKHKKIEKALELFEKGFLSSEKFSLDMKYFQNKRKEMLVQMIILLLFVPDKIYTYDYADGTKSYENQIKKFHEEISALYNSKKEKIATYLQINNLDTPPPRKKFTRNKKDISTT
jgi:transcriptional regulator with XRE-family HTH domain